MADHDHYEEEEQYHSNGNNNQQNYDEDVSSSPDTDRWHRESAQSRRKSVVANNEKSRPCVCAVAIFVSFSDKTESDFSFISFSSADASTWVDRKLMDFFRLGHHPGAGMHPKAVHRRPRLPHDRRKPEELLRGLWKDRRRGGHERPQNQAISWLRIHLVLPLKHGRRRTASSPTRHRWKVS